MGKKTERKRVIGWILFLKCITLILTFQNLSMEVYFGIVCKVTPP